MTIPFTVGAERLAGGTPLTAAEIKALRNHNRLIEGGFIKVYPPAALGHVAETRHVVHLGGGAFDVIAGRKLNDEPLTKTEAYELARAGSH